MIDHDRKQVGWYCDHGPIPFDGNREHPHYEWSYKKGKLKKAISTGRALRFAGTSSRLSN